MVTANSVVAERWRIAEVDPENPLLSRRDRDLLRNLVRKHQMYIEQGRGREAHGMGTAILAVWQTVLRPESHAEIPDTNHGDL
ncbi:MAG: hypothetical protein OEY03_13505 [Rhizobacter sp.]|nr:hypothetical protein [Rhizobacter sp.]